MLGTLKRFFDEKIKHAQDAALDEQLHRLHLATAALMLEMMRMDDEIKDEERARITALIQSRFALSAAETATLLELAEAERRQATDYYQFTSLINDNFTPAQKERVIQDLWEIALVDGHLDAHERHYLRKLTDLLYVSHAAAVHAKMRAERAVRGDPEKD